MKALKIMFLCIGLLTLWYFYDKNYGTVNEIPVAENCFTDASSYKIISHYPNGVIKKIGYIQNEKKEGEWSEFYSDGMLRRRISYANDSVQIRDDYVRFPYPRIILEHDSLIIGRKTRMRVLSIWPGEWLAASKNILVDSLADNSEYDYCITPLEGEMASFGYERRVLFDSFDVDYKELARVHKISEKEARKIFSGIYVKHNVHLGKSQIYPSE